MTGELRSALGLSGAVESWNTSKFDIIVFFVEDVDAWVYVVTRLFSLVASIRILILVVGEVNFSVSRQLRAKLGGAIKFGYKVVNDGRVGGGGL